MRHEADTHHAHMATVLLPAPSGGASAPGTVKVTADWRESAACRGKPTAWWFAADPSFRAEQPDSMRARDICAACPVRVQCADEAVERGERWGIWGGLARDEVQRRSAHRLVDKPCARCGVVVHIKAHQICCEDCLVEGRRERGRAAAALVAARREVAS